MVLYSCNAGKCSEKDYNFGFSDTAGPLIAEAVQEVKELDWYAGACLFKADVGHDQEMIWSTEGEDEGERITSALPPLDQPPPGPLFWCRFCYLLLAEEGVCVRCGEDLINTED